MSVSSTTRPAAPSDLPEYDPEYPDSDGLPIADNTKQYRWMVTFKEGLEDLFRDDPHVFIAADLFWYPVRGERQTRTAPDVLVAFGRPKGERRSYKQWEEGGDPPQVVFEVLSPHNTVAEMAGKLRFYERFGVEEYYVFDPDDHTLEIHLRAGDRLEPVPESKVDGWVSPRMRIQFDLSGEELEVIRPDGRHFQHVQDVFRDRDAAVRARDKAERGRQRAERRLDQAERLRLQEQAQREAAQHQADAAQQRADQLAERLRALGIDPDA
jgi:Uma2 family endonuclease